jgi:arylsulfatase
LVIHWPARIKDAGALRPQFCHVVDIAPTILGAVGVSVPVEFAGVPQIPLHGATIAATFDDAAAPPARSVQYFEQMGHRGLWSEGWKVTTYHEQGQPIDDDEWGLYNLDEDFSECHDLAAAHPEKLRELVDAWWVQAGLHGVMPLDDRTIELFGSSARPATPHARSEYVYFPPVSHVPADASPPLGGRNWTITATVDIPEGGAEGVLYARGGHNVGHSFFIDDGTLHFDYNALGVHHRVSARISLTPGRHEVTARFERREQGGEVFIATDGDDLASVEIPKIVRMLGSTGLDIGRDGLSPVVDDYEPPFAFTGTIDRIVFSIRSRADAAEIAAVARMELAKE